ncbi:hypothetical protein CWI84_07615 [Idiomarina tyrosinivorans]|uniref:Methyl-accepting transducer domain-containing protein n=1 Tax=Idiomarina tyrosinivorans TaxID=1445662 RepID=A0A432ZQP8_9GAMM|nr:methyl-accepting chemotaxis protein [Idiomarina tyrosinivorans]RUO80156.1 hypothetical protein CWI84_07615 [Idiomarina tyrosinivorans]
MTKMLKAFVCLAKLTLFLVYFFLYNNNVFKKIGRFMSFNGLNSDANFVFSLSQEQKIRQVNSDFRVLYKEQSDQLNETPLRELVQTLPPQVEAEIHDTVNGGFAWRGIVPFSIAQTIVWLDVLVRPLFKKGKVNGSQWLGEFAEDRHIAKAKQLYKKRLKQPLLAQHEWVNIAIVIGLFIAASFYGWAWLVTSIIVTFALIIGNYLTRRKQAKRLAKLEARFCESQHAIYSDDASSAPLDYEIALKDGIINAMMSRLGRGTEDIQEAINTTREHSENTVVTTGQASDSLDQIAVAMEQMSTTVDDIAHNASNSADACSDVKSQMKHADQFNQQSATTIHELVELVKSGRNTTRELNSNAENVSAVVEQIDGIAEQTNLLALNAAIEAARAGESGRGFAVVADEVRTLSQRTQRAVDEIQSSIHKMNAAVQASHEQMSKQADKAEEVGELSERTKEELTKVSIGVDDINDRMAQIAVAAEQHSSAVTEIRESVSSLTESSKHTTQLAKQTVEEVSGVRNRLREFRSLIEAFEDDDD